jgi:hypothetical protein
MTIIWKRFFGYILLILVTAVLHEIARELLGTQVKHKSRAASIAYRAVSDVLSWTTLIGMLWVWGFI